MTKLALACYSFDVSLSLHQRNTKQIAENHQRISEPSTSEYALSVLEEAKKYQINGNKTPNEQQ